MRVLGFGTYDRVRHPRVGILLDGLRETGDHVTELNRPLGFSTEERVEMVRRPWLAYRFGTRLAARWAALVLGRTRLPVQPEAVVVGYLGQFDVLLARVLFPRTTVALDLMIFAGDTAADRGLASAGKGLLLGLLDRIAIACADVVLVDTEEHREMVAVRARPKTRVVPVGADRVWFEAALTHREPGPLRVVFFGAFTPLQGTPVIGRALAALPAEPAVEVTMIGRGQDLVQTQRLAAAAAVTVRWLDWLDYADLPSLVAGQDVCLGIFAATGKGLRVTPNKVYQGAAAGCAIVTSDSPPQRRALADAALWVAPGDADALARALHRLALDRSVTEDFRRRASVRATDFTPRRVGEITHAALLSGPKRRPPRLSAMSFEDAASPDDLTRTTVTSPSTRFVPLAPNAAMRWDVVSRWVNRIDPSSTLELGCGQGGFGARLAARGGRYVGVEPDAQSAAVAGSRIEPAGGEVVVGTAADIDADPAFDLVCAFEVIEHVEDDVALLREGARHLRPGGWILVSVPAWPARFGPWDQLVGHYRRYTPDELAGVLTEVGCDRTLVTAYGWPLGYATETVRDKIAARRTEGICEGAGSMQARTAASGRLLQPTAIAAAAVRMGTPPFVWLQRLRPDLGTGLVGVGRLPH